MQKFYKFTLETAKNIFKKGIENCKNLFDKTF